MGDIDRALKATRFCDETIPSANIPYDYTAITLAQAYYAAGEKADGDRILADIMAQNEEYLLWAFTLEPMYMQSVGRTIREHIITMREALEVATEQENAEIIARFDEEFRTFFDLAYTKYKLLN